MTDENLTDKEVARKFMKLKLELNIAEGMLRLATSHHKMVNDQFVEFQSTRDKMFMGWDCEEPKQEKKFPSRTWQEAVRHYVGAPDDLSFVEVYELGVAQQKSRLEYLRKKNKHMDIKKDCSFQFAIDNKILAARNGLTRFEAELLFEQNRAEFIKLMERDETPEMCVWIDMDDDFDFHTKGSHWNAADMMLRDGKLYEHVY